MTLLSTDTLHSLERAALTGALPLPADVALVTRELRAWRGAVGTDWPFCSLVLQEAERARELGASPITTLDQACNALASAVAIALATDSPEQLLGALVTIAATCLRAANDADLMDGTRG